MPFLHWKIKELREAAGLSQSEVAEKTGVPIGTIRNLEQGRTSDPPLSSVERIADAFGVDACSLIGESPEVKPVKSTRGRPKRK